MWLHFIEEAAAIPSCAMYDDSKGNSIQSNYWVSVWVSSLPLHTPSHPGNAHLNNATHTERCDKPKLKESKPQWELCIAGSWFLLFVCLDRGCEMFNSGSTERFEVIFRTFFISAHWRNVMETDLVTSTAVSTGGMSSLPPGMWLVPR